MEDSTPMASTSAIPLKRTRVEGIQAQFARIRVELDAQADRRERIIKLSRDITSTSKKVIFSCHRIASVPLEQVIKDATPQFATLATLFAKLQAEVVGEEFWKYERSCSPGIQEYLEGLTFYHYLIHRTVPSLSEVQATLSNDQGPLVHVTVEDYLGGIADLSGEMMRLAIGSIGKSLSRPEGEDSNMISIESIGLVVRELKGAMDPLAPLVHNFHKKMVVLDQSLTKIESASYALKIRSAEYADSPVMLARLQARPVEVRE